MRRGGARAAVVAVISLVGLGFYFLYLQDLDRNPPGFNHDEASMGYNALSISRYGVDEYGERYPLYFPAFGEYKNPVQIYLVALAFKLGTPSTWLARAVSATEIFLGTVILGVLAFRITRNLPAANLCAVSVLAMPWMYELGRLVFEVQVLPPVLALFLLMLWAAKSRERWPAWMILTLGFLLAFSTYSYEGMKAVGPALAAGLWFFATPRRVRSIVATWCVYALLLIPLLVYTVLHPDAATARFRWSTPLFGYFGNELPLDMPLRFLRNYLSVLDLGAMFVFGDPLKPERHVPYAGGFLYAGWVGLVILGFMTLRRRNGFDAWWCFVLLALFVSPLPAALGGTHFETTRMVTLPIFLTPFMIAGLDRLLRGDADRKAMLLAAILLFALVAQAAFFFTVFARDGDRRGSAFLAGYPSVLNRALRQQLRPIFVVDRIPAGAGYIQALWWAEVQNVPRGTLVRIRRGQPLPPGALFLDEPECRDAREIARWESFVACLKN